MTKAELLRELFVKYGLSYDKNNPESRDNDVYVHKHYTVITRSGLDKIEKKAGITIEIDPLAGTVGPDWAVMRGIGYRQIDSQVVSYTTTASANTASCKTFYYAEMAEKRLRSRLILKLAGLYELGVYGKDEVEKEDEPPQVEKKTLFAQ